MAENLIFGLILVPPLPPIFLPVLHLIDVIRYCKFLLYTISQKLINQLKKIKKKLVSGLTLVQIAQIQDANFCWVFFQQSGLVSN